MQNNIPKFSSKQLTDLYEKLLLTYGRQKWWSAAEPFEIIIGAILVQNTNWNNVAKSLHQLKAHGLLSPEALQKIPISQLIKNIKPSGLYNQKAKYIKNFVNWYVQAGGIKKIYCEYHALIVHHGKNKKAEL